MGWLVTLGVIFFLAVLPLGVSVKYNAGGLLARVILGPVRFTVYPRPKREKKEKESKKQIKTEQSDQKEDLPKPPQPPEEGKTVEAQKEKGGSLTDFLPLVKVALDFLGDFRRKLRLKRLELKLILAGSDPCDLAVNYGRAWAAVGNLMPHLERLFVIKKRNIEVECDFTADRTLVIAHADVTITLGRLLALAVRYGIRALKEFLSIQKKRKGGAEK